MSLMEQSFRWFGPNDPVSIAHIRQAGAAAVFSALHQIPYGDVWPREAIRERKRLIESAGLRWTAVESVPVHDDIKSARGDLTPLFDNYKQTLRNLAAEGLHLVIYNFMPVLDWVRTDMRFVLPDGSECLFFNPIHFAAFELHALQRPNAKADYTPEQIDQATTWWNVRTDTQRTTFIRSIIDVFPGCKLGLSLDDIREMLARYGHIDEHQLRKNLARFLHEILPVAEQLGTRMAIHPDDPPFPVLALPRIVSTADHLAQLLQLADSTANGLCFCTGSLSARPDNDLPAMVQQFAPRIHAVHLRSTQCLPDGSFYEANHLEGSVNMPAVVTALLTEQDRRQKENRPDALIPFRPDHGHTLMDDLGKPPGVTPGYPALGRMKGLAELRGLMLGLRAAQR
jgi:mannonate dehydratase